MNARDIYNYLKPIVTGCSGFVKSNGFMLVQHDLLVMMSYDRSTIDMIRIQPLNILFVAYISDFVGCKDTPETFMQQCAFYGSNIILNEMTYKTIGYQSIVNNTPLEYCEDNVYNLPDFQEKLKTPIQWTVFSGNGQRYKMAVSKVIFPLNKGDECAVKIYDPYADNTRIMLYSVYKKKLKVTVDIFTRQYVFRSPID
ncbi:hypothetical protein [Bacteroides acidifaciens]|uniref:hypothetical protein n=1 Tax=Bacteroides acidifaciens TaxID=85831 RepID=UPI00263BA112|nr:hypothetical protein [Bacteroides acidifaciens]